MTVYKIDPLRDARWEDFVRCHLAASVFHTAGRLTSVCFSLTGARIRRGAGFKPPSAKGSGLIERQTA